MASDPKFNYLKPIRYDDIPEYYCAAYARKVAKDVFNKHYSRGPGQSGGDAWVFDDYNKMIWIEGSSVNLRSVLKVGMILVMSYSSSKFRSFILNEKGNRIKGKGTHVAVVVNISPTHIHVWNQIRTITSVKTIKKLAKSGFRVVKVIDTK